MCYAEAMFRQILAQIHVSWCFYAVIWGIIAGVAWGIIAEQVIVVGVFWLILAGLALGFSLYRPCRLTAIIAFLAGLIFGNFCTSAYLAGKNFASQFVNQTVIVSGQLIDDPDTSKGTASLRLRNLRFYNPSAPVENLWKTSAKPVEKPVENSNISDIPNLSDISNPSNLSSPSNFSNDFAPSDTPSPPLSNPSLDEFSTSVSGTLYVTLSQASQLERSDYILLEGKLSAGFGTFVGKMTRPQLRAISRSDPGDLFAKFKHWFASAVRQFIPSPQVDLGLGYLMGMKSGLSSDFSSALQAVGMTHVVVASGAHLAILITAAKKLFGKISKFAGLLFSLLMILAFVLIVGFTPSMTRAALVASLSLVMGYIGRKFTPLRLISFVAAITLLIDPANLLNLGWQLSFASFFGILVLAPRLQHTFYGGKTPPWLASMLITSISTSLVCAPVLIYNFGSLSLLSLLANLIILPTLPYAMLGMMLTGALSGFAFLVPLIATPTVWLLNLHIWLVNFLSEQTAFILEFPSANVWVYLLYLPILIYLIYPSVRRWRRHSVQAPHPVPDIA